jgi:hypothetical protein
VSIDSPVSASLGQEFSVVCTVVNRAAKPQKLVSLDVADGFLKGIVIHSAEPAFTEAIHVPIVNVVSYSFGRTLASAETFKVAFRCYAAKAGDWSGEVDFCVNTGASSLTYPLRIIVK